MVQPFLLRVLPVEDVTMETPPKVAMNHLRPEYAAYQENKCINLCDNFEDVRIFYNTAVK
jgi:hypothetical protein